MGKLSLYSPQGAAETMPAKKIELSDVDVSCIKIMAMLGMNLKSISAMLQSASGVKISARTLFSRKRTDPRVAAAFEWGVGSSSFAIAQKIFSIAVNPTTDPNTAFRCCRYWEITRGGIKDPQRRSVQHQTAAPGRVVIQD